MEMGESHDVCGPIIAYADKRAVPNINTIKVLDTLVLILFVIYLHFQKRQLLALSAENKKTGYPG
jgi:hypothetical protein